MKQNNERHEQHQQSQHGEVLPRCESPTQCKSLLVEGERICADHVTSLSLIVVACEHGGVGCRRWSLERFSRYSSAICSHRCRKPRREGRRPGNWIEDHARSEQGCRDRSGERAT
jgi:hypothetical protein